jgi:hypothetical protein
MGMGMGFHVKRTRSIAASRVKMSLRDLVPWALVYSAQNDRHADDMQRVVAMYERRLAEAAQRTAELNTYVITSLLLSSTFAFNDRSSYQWKAFAKIRPTISIVDIDDAAKIWRFGARQHDVPELSARAAILCSVKLE